MKKMMLFCFVVVLLGCSNTQDRVKGYFSDPQSLLKDPHFAEHKKELNTLERSYLDKEITYAEYMQQKQTLEEQYTKEVQDRKEIIENYRN